MTEIEWTYNGGVDIISDAIVNSLGREDTQNFMWLFALIEKYLKEGDKEVKELLSYGLIDHLQESLIKKRMKLSALDPWLRDETKDVWQSMIDIWSQADRPDYHVEQAPNHEKPYTNHTDHGY